MTEPARAYIVCSTPRSGSSLLCTSLAQTGLAGLPTEPFNLRERPLLTAEWGCEAGARAFAAALRERRPGPNGVLGLKLHWSQLDGLRRELCVPPEQVLAELFPGALYVRIVRLDRVSQAVSLHLAKRTGRWSSSDGPPGRGPRFSFRAIERCLREIADGEAGWERTLKRLGAQPVAVTYEDLCRDREGVVRYVLRAIAPDADPAPLAAPQIERQADAVNRAMADRYRRARDRSPCGRLLVWR